MSVSRAFEKTFHARWGDMDFNGHMKNTAYLDVSGDVRMMYFAEHGFPMREFERLKMGPVILRDELAGLSANASRFRLRNEFFREDRTFSEVKR